MTEFNLDPNEYALTPLQLMKLRGATTEEIKAYEARRKKRKPKEWGALATPINKSIKSK